MIHEPTKRISTNGSDFKFSRGEVVYRSKTKSINDLSPTEAELIAAVTDTKTEIFLRYMLWELRLTQVNYPTIDIVNLRIPTEITRHIYARFFAIHGWKRAGDIIMHHIPRISILRMILLKHCIMSYIIGMLDI